MTRQLWGPFAPLGPTPLQVALPPDTAWILVQNCTAYDCSISFAPTAPVAISNEATFGTGNQVFWNALCRRGLDTLIATSGKIGSSSAELATNAIGSFTGILWLSLLNNTGILGSWLKNNNQIYIVTGDPVDVPPQVMGDASFVDLSSQPRVAAIPPMPAFNSQSFANITAGNTWTNADGARGGLNIGNYPNNNQAVGAQLTSPGTFWLLIYSWSVSMDPGAASPFTTGMYFRLAVFDSAPAMVATYPNMSATDGGLEVNLVGIGTVGLTSRIERVYAYPLAIKVVLSANAGAPYTIVPQIRVDTINGNPTGSRANCTFDVMDYFIPLGATGSTATNGAQPSFNAFQNLNF